MLICIKMALLAFRENMFTFFIQQSKQFTCIDNNLSVFYIYKITALYANISKLFRIFFSIINNAVVFDFLPTMQHPIKPENNTAFSEGKVHSLTSVVCST